jgi:hypothetical protein
MSKCFPYDYDTLFIIKEAESLLSLDSNDCNKMNKTDLIEYIDQLAIQMLSNSLLRIA